MLKKIILIPVLIAVLCFLPGCTGGGSGGGSTPTSSNYTEITMTGNITFPEGCAVDLSDLLVAFGENESVPDSGGAFDISGNQAVPGLAIVCTEDTIPMLMGLVPNPDDQTVIELNSYSTALALILVNPLLCPGSADDIYIAVSDLEGLPEFQELAGLLYDKIRADANVLNKGDADIEELYNRVIVAYLNLVQKEPPGSSSTLQSEQVRDEDIIVDPGNIVGGLQVSHVGTDTFKVANYYGRWLYGTTPYEGEGFWISPNGDFLDFFFRKQPWAPSEAQFYLNLEDNAEPVEVNMYGIGFSTNIQNQWYDLNENEHGYCIRAGFFTIMVEVAPRILSLISNTSLSLNKTKIANNELLGKLGDFALYNKIAQKTVVYAQNRDGWGWMSDMTKEFLANLAWDKDFRKNLTDLFGELVGEQIAKSAARSLARWLLVPIKVLTMGDDVTGMAKTLLGFKDGRFRTRVDVSKRVLSWGSIQGWVVDEKTDAPIEGVTVELEGDDDNPISTNHMYVTDPDGGFWFENIQTGKKEITVTKPGYAYNTVEIVVQEGENEVEIELSDDILEFKYIRMELFLTGNFEIGPDDPYQWQDDYHMQIWDCNFSSMAGNTYIFYDETTVSQGELYMEVTLSTNMVADTVEIESFRGIRTTNAEEWITGGGGVEVYRTSYYVYEGYVQGYAVGNVLNEVSYIWELSSSDQVEKLTGYVIDENSLIRFHLQLAD